METCVQKQPRGRRVRQAVLHALAPTAIMAALWMVLGWVRSAGVQMAILWPLCFLTGALNGMEGSTLGGIVGKTLLLVLLNSFIKGVVIQTRGGDGRRRNFWKQFKANAANALLARIPQFFNVKNLWNAGSVTAAGCGLLGLAAAVLVYPFITGDGSFVNSMVCGALCLSIFSQFARQRGLLIALINLLLARRGGRTIDRQPLEMFFTGAALGMAASMPISLTRQLPAAGEWVWLALARVLPGALAAAAVLIIFWGQVSRLLRRSGRGAAVADRAQNAGKQLATARALANERAAAAQDVLRGAARRDKEGRGK